MSRRGGLLRAVVPVTVMALMSVALSPAMAGGTGTGTGPPTGRGEMTWTDDFDRPDGPVGNDWSELRGDWAIASAALRTDTGPQERVVAQTGFALGERFDIHATLRIEDESNRRWNGVAFNVSDNGDGTQDFYVLRLVNTVGERVGAWQLLQVTDSVVDDDSLIAQGALEIAAGGDYTVRISSSTYGVVELGIAEGGTRLLDQPEIVPLGDLLAGGHAGLYSSNGGARFDRVRVITSRKPANPPSPGPLQCPPVDGPPYELPDEQEEVAEKVVVDRTWAGHPVGQSVLTSGSEQYVAYYDAERQLVVAHRTTGEQDWTKQPLDTAVGWDSHNYVTMALDRAGHLHVSGNMHGVPLIYYRTTVPGDVTSLVRVPTMVDPGSEQRVTYPRFFRTPDDALVFRYRDGGSGNGADIYNRYDEETSQWQRLLDQPLHDGEGLRNAYVNGPLLGPDGYYHLAWVWRDTPDAATNQHLSYARSRDLVHWERSDGTPLTLPITYDSGEVVDPVPMNGGIINGNTEIGFDADGRVLLSYHKYDKAGNTQIYLARRERRGWTIHQVSDWQGRWTIGGRGTLRFEVDVSAVSVLPDGNLRLAFRCHDEQRTWVLDPEELRPISEVDSPQLPSELTDVRSDFPEMLVNFAGDLGVAEEEGTRYLLRWESLPSNQDRPRDPPWPDPGPLEVYLLRR
ncbi:MAG TPA: BNR repeat-containing protein [Actinopolymorphaceae bacterium]